MSLASPSQSPTLPPEISTSHLCLAAESTFSVGRSTRMVKKSLVENATFSLPGPGFVAICGASGSGKTLLLNTLAGLLPPADGLLRIDDENASAWKMKRRRRFWRERAAIIHQDHGIMPELSCEDNLTLGLSRKQYSKEELLHSLGEVGLDVPFDGPAAILSGGEQQRLAIARAVITRPGLIVADEPTGSVDAVMADKLLRLFQSLNKLGATVLIASHDEALAQRSGARVLRLEAGRLSEPSRAAA